MGYPSRGIKEYYMKRMVGDVTAAHIDSSVDDGLIGSVTMSAMPLNITSAIDKTVKADILSDDLYDEIFEKIASRFNKAPVVKHECHCCGATLEMDSSKHIFVCKYCGSAYAVGTTQINARI